MTAYLGHSDDFGRQNLLRLCKDAYSSRVNQDTIRELFMFTMKTLMDAPETSKLAMYKFEDVGLFYIQLTRPDQLEQPCSMLNDMSNVNDGLAFIISNFVISTPESFYIRNFLKFLLKLQISTTNFTQLRELKQLYTQMVYSLKNKLVLKSQKKFGSSLNEFISHDPERIENEDPECL